MRHSPKLGPTLAAAVAASMVTATATAGDELALAGWLDLIARVGPDAPDGSGVITCEVEPEDENGNYGPRTGHAVYAGKSFTKVSGPTSWNSHANNVGYRQFSLESMAAGIDDIYLYETFDWLTSGYLNATELPTVLPTSLPAPIKTMNCSWIGSWLNVTQDNETLRRADYAIHTDDLLLTCGLANVNGTNNPLMTYGFNSICVGVRAGVHIATATPSPYDGPGRRKPEIVGPAEFSSYATPLVNATASVLTETARTHESLFANPNAERSEVLKAVILASAVHEDVHDGDWSNDEVESGSLRGVTTTPIDDVVGVGTVNVDRAHLVLTGLEQDGATSEPAAVNISWRGWDLASGGVGQSLYYRISLTEDAELVSVVATWHRRIRQTVSNWQMADFDLHLWRVGSTGDLESLVGAPDTVFADGNVTSESAVDNLEHLFLRGLAAGDYVIEVRRIDSLPSPWTNWDVAVAWQFSEPSFAPTDLTQDGLVNFNDLLVVLLNWGTCSGCPADINGDGEVDFNDLVLILFDWS